MFRLILSQRENMTKGEKVENQEKVVEDYTNTLKRLQADFENYIKRVDKEKQEFANYSNYKLVAKMLTILDDFDKAMEAIKSEPKLADGFSMIYQKMNKLLQEEGVVPIEAVGNKLDPYKHEVIDLVDGEDDIVVEEIQKGYMMKDKVLRTSKVRISKKKEK